MNRTRKDDVWELPVSARGKDVRFGGGGRASSSLSPAAKARLGRIVRRAPEVMVRITGRTRGMFHLKEHLDYVTRNGKLLAETGDGQPITSRAELRELHDDWLQANAVMARGRNGAEGAQSVSVILSMPNGTAPDRVQEAARSWARETFGERFDWIMARHDDKGHPHVHVTVRAVGHDGKRLVAGPDDLQRWRERFAGELRRLGIEAEATPRKARGNVRKADPMPVHKIAVRGGTPTVRRREHNSAASEVAAPSPHQPYGWEREIQARQDGIRRAYLQHAAELATGDAEDRRLSRDIERFVGAMPVPLTRRQALVLELRRVAQQHRASEHSRAVGDTASPAKQDRDAVHERPARPPQEDGQPGRPPAPRR